MADPELSVIVPVYNVEAYLDRCLGSIVGQSYRDFEVILINDGSMDGSAILCESWASRYSCIRYVSHENRGISAVRNEGVKLCRGRYIMFVDSDDWVEPDIAEVLVSNLHASGADISIGRIRFEDDDGRLVHRKRQLGNSVVSGSDAFVALQFERRLQAYSHAKVFARRLFAGISYPDGKVFEDYLTTPKLFAGAEKVVSTSRVLYHYIQRAGSILHDASREREKLMTLIEFTVSRYEFALSTAHLSPYIAEQLRIKSIRRIVRHLWRLAGVDEAGVGGPAIVSGLGYLSRLLGREVEYTDLHPLYRWTMFRRVGLFIFRR